MNTLAASRHAPAHDSRSPRALLARFIALEPVLMRFGLAMWIAMIPAAIALGLDDRVLRGVSVWIKPLKFMASTGLFALTAGWVVSLLPQARRAARPVRWAIAALIAATVFEVGYITLQAALGQASHYSTTPLGAVLYAAMAVGALTLTATQLVLAWEVRRHAAPSLPPALRQGVVHGLVLTFVLGSVVGMMLGGRQPPSGAQLPIVGWHLLGDLRPAHFVGIHAQQVLPLVGWLVAGRLAGDTRGTGRGTVWAASAGWTLLWCLTVAAGLSAA